MEKHYRESNINIKYLNMTSLIKIFYKYKKLIVKPPSLVLEINTANNFEYPAI